MRSGSSIEDFMYGYWKILQKLGDTYAYICGKLTLDWLQYGTCNFVISLDDFRFEYAYIFLINKPSRISRNSETSIDHIWHNRFDSAK